MNATTLHWWFVNIGPGNGSVPPMLTHSSVAIRLNDATIGLGDTFVNGSGDVAYKLQPNWYKAIGMSCTTYFI